MEMTRKQAPDGWYDGRLIGIDYVDNDAGSAYLEIHLDIGPEWFAAKERIYLTSVPTGDAQKDAERAEWTRQKLDRVKDAFPSAVVNGSLDLSRMTPETCGGDKIRVKLATNAKGYSDARVYRAKTVREPASAADIKARMLPRLAQLAKLGLTCSDATAPAAADSELDDGGVPF